MDIIAEICSVPIIRKGNRRINTGKTVKADSGDGRTVQHIQHQVLSALIPAKCPAIPSASKILKTVKLIIFSSIKNKMFLNIG